MAGRLRVAEVGSRMLDPYEEIWHEKIAQFVEGRDGTWWRGRMVRRAMWRLPASVGWKSAQAW